MSNKGYFYCGFYPQQRKNGIFKIGETSVSPSSRQASIIKTTGKQFKIIQYILISEVNKPQRLFIESYVREKLTHVSGLVYDENKNDHFTYSNNIDFNGKYFSEKAIEFALEAIKFLNITDFRIRKKE